MKEKVLKQFTQIPKHLYVMRGADEQVKRIIEDMLRPGYVSVARQMGKTNLLQNAQRSLQNENQIITYIDVSSTFYNNVQEYFRYIIDTILETNELIFESLNKEILLNRGQSNISPAKEHQNELRNILKHFSGNVIIILDEVDSLVRYDFSDQIFAQIRSIYFMKNTFKELSNLTYLLSGVIEPTKIIKSKENSPFNIAQKIYLDDFSRDEFDNFIKQSRLEDIGKNTIDKVYHWTNGNPRMTYDVCSALEDIFIQQSKVDETDVNTIVDTLYLSRYDQAPVDHIRDIITDNALLRNAIFDLRKGINLSDDIKSQLYLFGIINSNFEIPSIKNPIIDKAISDEWLTSIEIQNRGLYLYGLECISNRKYPEAITALSKYIDEFNDDDFENLYYAKYYLGIAYSDYGNYGKSNEYLLSEPISDSSNEFILYCSQFNTLAVNFLMLEEYEKAEMYLTKVLNFERKEEAYARALLNLSALYYRTSQPDKVIEYSEKVVDFLLNYNKIKSTLKKKYLSIAYYNIGQFQDKNHLSNEALLSYENALQFAEHSLKPTLLLKIYQIQKSIPEKVRVLTEAINTIIDSKLTFSEKSIENQIAFSKEDLDNIFVLSYIHAKDKFEELLEYSCHNILKISIEEVTFNIALQFMHIGGFLSARELFTNITSTSISDKVLRHSFLYISLIDRNLKSNYSSSFNNYYNLFINRQSTDLIQELDLTVFINVLLDLRENGNYKLGLTYSAVIEKELGKSLPELLYDRLLLYYLISDFNIKANNLELAKLNSLKCLTLVKQLERSVSSYKQVNSANINYIKNVSENIAFKKSKSTISVSLPVKKKRNIIVTVKTKTGEVKTGKYKLFEKGLQSGEYFLIE